MRRKRSEMNEAECVSAVKEFAKRIDRMVDSSAGVDGHSSFAPDGHITALISVKGNFGSNDDFWEAMRVFGEHKLPAKP